MGEMQFLMTKTEANSEAQRIRNIRRGGNALVIGSAPLSHRMNNIGFSSTLCSDVRFLPDKLVDVIALPYPALSADELPDAFVKVIEHLHPGGFFRVLLINRSHSTLTDATSVQTPILDKSRLISLLTDAGFKSIVLDHRLFWRDAMMMAGPKHAPWFYAPWAWLKSRRAQGGILAATAWK